MFCVGDITVQEGVWPMTVATFTSCKGFYNAAVAWFSLCGDRVEKHRSTSKGLDVKVGYGVS